MYILSYFNFYVFNKKRVGDRIVQKRIVHFIHRQIARFDQQIDYNDLKKVLGNVEDRLESC